MTEGALVGQAEATKLALIQQVDPIYADFNATASDPSLLVERAGGMEATEVRLVLPNGSLHADAGRLLFTDVSVDPGTGQVSLRATFPNPRVALLPGTYVRIQVRQGTIPGAIVVPAQAHPAQQRRGSASLRRGEREDRAAAAPHRRPDGCGLND